MTPTTTPIHRDEARLVANVRAGNCEAFSDLLSPHIQPIFRLIRMLTRSDNDAEDLLQQAMLKAFMHLDQFRSQSTFKTWLTAIALNEARQYRRQKSHSRLVFDDPSEFKSSSSYWEDSPWETLERKEALRLIGEALSRLPERYRLMIQMRDLREMSIAETAQHLSMTISAVKTRHLRARRQLQRLLRKSRPALGLKARRTTQKRAA
jgi:RNA polymerase sigma-70 factor (ECF subfamily)